MDRLYIPEIQIQFYLIYLQKPIDHPDGILDDILQHVPGVINATSSAIGLVADRFFPVCGGGPINQRSDSSNGDSDKHVGYKRVRSYSSDSQDRSSVPGQAASNGPVQAKKKTPLTYTKAAKLAKTPKRFALAGRIRKVQKRQVETPRPANRSLVDGYDSDTRDE